MIVITFKSFALLLLLMPLHIRYCNQTSNRRHDSTCFSECRELRDSKDLHARMGVPRASMCMEHERAHGHVYVCMELGVIVCTCIWKQSCTNIVV